MKVFAIKSLDDGEAVDIKVVVMVKKDRNRYKVFDRTGEIWMESSQNLEEGGVYRVRGVYKGGVVFAEEVERIENPNWEEFLPVSGTIEEDEKRFWALVEKIEDPTLRSFAKALFEPIWESFKKGVAAKNYHHAYIGGLLQHSANVGEIAYNLARFYNLKTDIVLLGAILHDIGKVWEFDIFPKFEHNIYYSKLGHIFLGAHYVREKAREFNIPKEIADEIVHIILSHHGEYVRGSPVLPKTPEAMLVHLVDNLDAQMNHILMKNEKDR
jgi:putative nucleotidyltransferase with HDIG domain